MRKTFAVCTLFFLIVSLGVLFAQTKKPPEKLVFEAKNGNVAFNHAEHVKREKGNCKVCHDKLFPMNAKAPLTTWKAGMHKTAMASETSCGFCHRAGGQAFAAAPPNCKKCHGTAPKS